MHALNTQKAVITS